MICAVKDEATKQRFLASLFEKDTTATHCDLGAHFEAFYTLPGSGWSFYTGTAEEPPFALAIQGRRAMLAGKADPEELDSFLSFLGVQRLKTSGTIPEGWQPKEQARRFVAACKMPLPQNPFPQNITIDKMPSMIEVAEFLQQGETFGGEPQEVLDAFYSEACTLRNHGLGEIWALRKDGKMVATAGAYGIWNNTAYLAAVETSPLERKQGFAKVLVLSLVNHLAEQGCLVELLCKPGSEGFYQSLGFLEQGTGGYYCPPSR